VFEIFLFIRIEDLVLQEETHAIDISLKPHRYA